MPVGEQFTVAGSLRPGSRLNEVWEIDEKIAVGGMGEVYRGHNIHTDDRVAIKVVRVDFADPDLALAMFRKEGAALNTLYHEAIVRYYMFALDPAFGRPYLVMEFVDGRSLKAILAEGALSYSATRILAERVGEGLAAAHDRGIFHRDISPDNIILNGDDPAKAKIIDFGIARNVGGSLNTVIGDSFAGKYSYASPEQIGAYGGTIDGRSDIYSFGLVLAEANTGRKRDMAGSTMEVIEKRQRVPDLSDVDPRLQSILTRMLAPDPADRPASFHEIVAELRGTGLTQAGGTRHPAETVMRPRPVARSGTEATMRPPGDPPTSGRTERPPTPPLPTLPVPTERPAAPQRKPGLPLGVIAALGAAAVAAAGGGVWWLMSAPQTPDVKKPAQVAVLPPAVVEPPSAPAKPSQIPSTAPAVVPKPAAEVPLAKPAPQTPPVATTEPAKPAEPPAQQAVQPPPQVLPQSPRIETPPNEKPPLPAPVPEATPARPPPEPIIPPRQEVASPPVASPQPQPQSPPASALPKQAQPAVTAAPLKESALTPQPAPTAPVAPAPPKKALSGEVERNDQYANLRFPNPTRNDVERYLLGYPHNGCFYLDPERVDVGAASTLAYGNSVLPFNVLDEDFKRAFGFSIDIHLNMVMPDQCALLDYLAKAPRQGQVDLVVNKDRLTDASTLSGVTTSPSGHLGVVLVEDNGLVRPIAVANPGAGKLTFQAKVGRQTAGGEKAQLVLAIAAPSELDVFRTRVPLSMADFLAQLQQLPDRSQLALKMKYLLVTR